MNKHYRDVIVRQWCLAPEESRKTIVVFATTKRFVRWRPDLSVEPVL